MTFVLVILAGLFLFGAGLLVGEVDGHRAGSASAYRAVNDWQERHR